MPVLLKDYRVNDFSKRCTVYSKLKRIITRGFETSNDYYAGGNFGILQGLNDNSKEYFSLICSDIIKFNNGTGDLYVACGENAPSDTRKGLSTFLYSEDNGVSWTFSNDTFGTGFGTSLIISDGTLFCGGTGTDDGTNYYGLMSSADGKTWTKVNSPPIFGKITNIATNNERKIIAAGWDTSTTSSNEIVAVSVNNGSNWTLLSNNDFGISINSTVKTYYAEGRFYLGITNNNITLTVYTALDSTDLTDSTNWSQVTLDDSANGILNGVYYSSSSSQYILYLESISGSLNSYPVYYSINGSNFTASTGIDINIYGVSNVTYHDSNFYLSVSYNDDSLLSDTPIMYTSSNGHSWTEIITNTDLSDFSNYVTGISQFFIKDSTIIACGTIGNTDPFGLVSIALPDHTVTGSNKAIALGDEITKLFHDEDSDAILVGVYKYPTTENTIYYYDGNQGKLVATEHHEDVA